MVRVYMRCNSGHYFTGPVPSCPLDGWSCPETDAVFKAAQRMTAEGTTPTIERLRAEDISQETLDRTIIIQFGSDASAFEALAPEGYIIGEAWRTMPAVPAALR
jgi:hypothetical protein